MCQDYGFSDMGVFIDWTSGYQKDPSLWAEWMADTALYSLSDDELRNVCALSEDQRRNLPDGERLVAERRAYEESRSELSVVCSRTPWTSGTALFNHGRPAYAASRAASAWL